MEAKLYQLKPDLKILLSIFLLILTIGVSIGLIYVRETTSLFPDGVVERYNGSEIDDEFEIPESYPKQYKELLLTTHNHVITFSLIFISVALIFYFNSVVTGFWKLFLIIEPFISILTTFGSIWALRFIDPSFVYLTIISSIIMYGSYFIMVGISLFDLNIKK